MVLAVQSRPHTMHAAIRGLGGTVLAKGGLTLVIDEVGLFINHRTQEPTGVDAWVRLFKDGSELPVDPHRIFINPPLIHDRIYDPRAAFEVILWQSVLNVPNPKGWRTRGTVTTVYAGTADDGIVSRASTYSNARAGTSTTTFAVQSGASWNNDNTVIEVLQQRNSSSDFIVCEGFIAFDTSSLPDTDTVSAAALGLVENAGYGSGFGVSDTLEARTYDWGASVTTADFRAGATYNGLTLLASLASGSWSTTGYNTLTENGTNFQSAINKTGTTYIVLGTQKLAAGTAPPSDGDQSYWGIMSADNTGTTNDPKLVVTHAASSVSASITGVVATATAAGVAGTVTAQKTTSIAGAAATSTAAGVSASISAQVSTSISGAVASATAASLASTVTTVRTTSIAGEAATASATAQVATVTAARIVSVAGEVATSTASALAPTVAAQVSASIAGAVATATATAHEASVAALVTTSVSGEAASATAAGNEATITAVRIASIAGEVATATAVAQEPVISSGSVVNASISGAVATATAAGLESAISTVRIAAVSGTTAAATAAGNSPTVTAERIVSIAGAVASATAAGQEATIAALRSVSVAGAAAQATSAPLAGSVATVRIVSVLGEVATSTTTAHQASVSALQIALVAGETATATAEALLAIINPPAEITPEAGLILRALDRDETLFALQGYDGIETLRALDRDEALNPLEART